MLDMACRAMLQHFLPILFAAATASTSPHEWAVAYQNVESHGIRATFNVWNPYVEQPGEFSLSQLWLLGGTQTLEAGWQVSRNLYGDDRTHLFIYSSAAGCYNLNCKGFVQTNPDVVIGGPLSCTSVEGGPQCEITLEYSRSDYGDWWLKVDGAAVGYYPAALFTPDGLGRGATTIEVGGEVVNQAANGQHTTTWMGSGRAPTAGYGHAAYIRGVQYVDAGNSYRDAASLTMETPGSYQIAANSGYIFFGGPGRALSQTQLRAASTSTTSISTPSALDVAFTIDATMDDNVIVGAALNDAAILTDDRRAALSAGSNAVVRSFAVPPALPPGSYALTATIWRDLNRNGVIDHNDQLLGTVTYPDAITVAAPRLRASR
jgi:hypothetical protein